MIPTRLNNSRTSYCLLREKSVVDNTTPLYLSPAETLIFTFFNAVQIFTTYLPFQAGIQAGPVNIVLDRVFVI